MPYYVALFSHNHATGLNYPLIAPNTSSITSKIPLNYFQYLPLRSKFQSEVMTSFILGHFGPKIWNLCQNLETSYDHI